MSNFIIYDRLEKLDAESKLLIEKAKEATNHAYAPYSNFLVGTALLLVDGTIVTGTNQENAAYPACMCAERVALYSAISTNPQAKVSKMVVIAKRKDNSELLPATSCGPCRQVMLGFEQRQVKPFEIVMLNEDYHWVKASSAASLLPFCFTKASLDNDQQK